MLDAFRTRCGNSETTLLVDGEGGQTQLESIRSSLNALAGAGLSERDTAILFFAGHGASIGGRDYLIPADAENKLGGDDLEDVTATLISTDDIIASLTASGAGTSVLMIDACRDSSQRNYSSFGESTAEMARRRGSIVFFSCSPGETSSELGSLGGGHGVFSFCLIDAIKRGLGTPLEIDGHVSKGVIEICAKNKLGIQRPYTAVAPVQKAVLDVFDGSIRSGGRQGTMILVAGPSNAGKTTLGRHLAATLGYTHVEMSSFAWGRFSKEAGYDGSLQDYLEELLWPQAGKDVLASDMLEAVQGLQNVVVCGPRRAEEVDLISKSGWNVIPIYLYANSLVRYDRLRNQREVGRYSINYKDFIKKDLKEYSWGLARIALMPRFEILVSSDTLERLQPGIVELAKRLGVVSSNI
jgi:adenylate kinase family enzyme